MPVTRSEAQAARVHPRRSCRLSSKMLQREKSSGQKSRKAQLVGKVQPLLPFPRRKSSRRSCPSEITSRKPGRQHHTDPAPSSSSCVLSRPPLQSLQPTHTAAGRSGRSGNTCLEAEEDEGKPEPHAEEDVLWIDTSQYSPIPGLKEDNVQAVKTMRL